MVLGRCQSLKEALDLEQQVHDPTCSNLGNLLTQHQHLLRPATAGEPHFTIHFSLPVKSSFTCQQSLRQDFCAMQGFRRCLIKGCQVSQRFGLISISLNSLQLSGATHPTYPLVTTSLVFYLPQSYSNFHVLLWLHYNCLSFWCPCSLMRSTGSLIWQLWLT